MFEIGLPDDMLDRMWKREWWRELLAYRDEGIPLFVAVRNNYLSVYVCGRAIFKEIREKKNGAIHAIFDKRYFYGPKTPVGDLIFNGDNVCDKKSGAVIQGGTARLRDLERWVKEIKKYKLVNLDDVTLSKESMDIGEKECLASRAANPKVINLEMALKGFVSNGRRTAPRIDMVHLERNGPDVACVFTEAKLFRNKDSLRKSGEDDAPVVTQVLDYKRYLEKNKDDIRSAYRKACKLLIPIRKAQGAKVDSLLEDVAGGASLNLVTLPRVLIFRTGQVSPRSAVAWAPHREKIVRHGIAVEEVDAVD